jgi:acyl-CoA thioesterase
LAISTCSGSHAAGRRLTGNSIDNTLRVVGRDETEWVLLDVVVDAIRDGYAHLGAHLWSEAGALLAIATQTLVVREPQADGRP